MTTKKKLITRMALGAAGVLAVALLAGGVALLKDHNDRVQWQRDQGARRAELLEQSRGYLAELAKKIDALPVNPTLVSEIESRYFEERARGPLAVWAMGTDGAFLFGVPRESFQRMNAIYDREITPRLKEGVFFDRQSFFLGHIEEDDETLLLHDLSEDAGSNDDAAGADLLERLGRHADRSEDSFVLSAPLKTGDGQALGSLYLKRSAPEREDYFTDERLQAVGAGAGAVASLAFVFLWILLPTWVYVDARQRGVRRAPLFAFLTVISSLVGLVVYLIARPEEGRGRSSARAAHGGDGGAYCPHCGHDLSASFCSTCRYPLKPDWAFCPSCRTEIKAPPAPEAARVG